MGCLQGMDGVPSERYPQEFWEQLRRAFEEAYAKLGQVAIQEK